MKFWIAILMLVTLTGGCAVEQPLYYPGLYQGESLGYYLPLAVAVEVDEYQILSIEVISHEEIKILADIVFDELPPRIIKKNSTDVDGVAGATYTSHSLLKAVEEALEKARRQDEKRPK
jgi:fumarate reductase flavoprotein subunit